MTADTWASTALGHLADVERALRPAPAAPTEPDDPPCAKCGQPVTDERFAVQSYETGAWTHDPCPPVCTPSTYPTGAMERMSRRGDIEAGAAIAHTAAAPLGAGPGLTCTVCRGPIDTNREPYVADGSLQHYQHKACAAPSAPQGPSMAVLRELAAEFYIAGDEWAGVRLETVAGLTSDPASAPRAEPPRTIDPSTGHYGDPVVMECGGEPGCGQTEHHVCFMCSKCDAHRYPNTSPRSHWMASAPQGGPDLDGFKWYAVVDGDVGIADSADEARDAAEQEMQYPPEDFESVEWGLLVPFARGAMLSSKPGPEGNEDDVTASFHLAPLDALAKLRAASPPQGERPTIDDTTRPSMNLVSPEGIDAALASEDTTPDVSPEDQALLVELGGHVLAMKAIEAQGEPAPIRVSEPRRSALLDSVAPAYVPKVGDPVEWTVSGAVAGVYPGPHPYALVDVGPGSDKQCISFWRLRPTSDKPLGAKPWTAPNELGVSRCNHCPAICRNRGGVCLFRRAEDVPLEMRNPSDEPVVVHVDAKPLERLTEEERDAWLGTTNELGEAE